VDVAARAETDMAEASGGEETALPGRRSRCPAMFSKMRHPALWTLF